MIKGSTRRALGLARVGRSAAALLVAAAGLQACSAAATQPAATSETLVEHTSPDDRYVPGRDSMRQAGVPQGEIIEFTFHSSRIFPGTHRRITVYVPAQYTADKPACVYVGLDSLAFNVPTVFDNLIHQREMPVTIGIGIASGVVDPADAQSVSLSAPAEAPETPTNRRFNRSYEFDGLGDNLARFVLEEIIPAVESRKTTDGRAIRLSKDPNDRAAGGASTGAIGSFTLAWQRPDEFRRVFTAIGTFVGMRGGDRYPVLVRKTEPKPIRIFMQDGSHDGLPGFNDEAGDWWMSNQSMERALTFAGYEVAHEWGEGSHDARHATAVFPDAMRWLWKDWPRAVLAGQSQNTFLKDILIPGEGWRAVPETAAEAKFLAAQLSRGHPRYSAFGAQHREYFTKKAVGELWLHIQGKSRLLDSGLQGPTGVAISPDGSWLSVAESKTHCGYSYRIQSDGTVTQKQKFYWFHVPDDGDDSGAGSWIMDRNGRLYAATRLGVQVFDHNGRVRGILPAPQGEITAVGFGGSSDDVLYVGAVNRGIFARRLKVPGVLPNRAPIQMPNWGAG